MVNAYRAKHSAPTYCSKVCMRAAQRLRTGSLSPKWRGGLVHQRGGYILEYAPDHPCANAGGYVLQHRLVMERHLGYLLPGDHHVHHMNGDKMDNRLENLQLLPKSAHHALHNPASGRWAKAYDACIDCAETKRRHYGGGRCSRCYKAHRLRSA